ncbi:hypothetical protein AALP_AA6G155100 [Arabis alpina]|uniref:WPP domain-containing protein n=1 Tax=Arabis alpina TaxID=50452 RepID=A0A087GPF4_ARAAL|nr:hypothetical protein AALP_AA6G155100 [Arabis alpina]
MAETETIRFNATSPPQPSESDNPDANPMKETRKESEVEKKKKKSLRIWPPSQNSRDAVVNRLVETLTTVSIFSKRYGTLGSEEALIVAKNIEEEAYGVVLGGDGDGDGDGC